MQRDMGLTGEKYDHKVAGIFGDAEGLRACRKELLQSMEEAADQLESLEPGAESPSWLVEPESRGIWHTLVRAHLWLGLAGVVAALLLFGLLAALDVPFVVQNPWASLFLMIVPFGLSGGMLGGLVTIRPDHTPYIARVKAALDDKRHVLVFHGKDRKQTAAARECVERYADETVATL